MLPLILLALLSTVSGQESWQQYIVGPSNTNVLPVTIISFNGNITNPSGLLANSGEATLSRAAGDEPPSVVVDFGMVTVGFLTINFTGATPNIGVRLAFSETLEFLTYVSDYSRGQLGADQLAVDPDPYVWVNTPGCKVDNKVCSDGLHAFRYVRLYVDALETDTPVTTSYGTLSIQGISVAYSGFIPTVDSFQGWFECSDQILTSYWYAGVYTNDLTTDIFRATDVDPRDAASPTLEGKIVLFDGAKRDRDPYVGDIAISGLTTYLSHGSLASEAAKNVLADLADHQRDDGWIPPASIFNYTLPLFDYSLWWITSVWDYTLYTNDTTLVEQYFPNLVSVLNSYYPANTNSTSHLISRPAGYGDFAFVPRDGEVAYYNALYVLSLNYSSKMADLLGFEDLSEEWSARAINVSSAVNSIFWDESVGAYQNVKGDTSSHPQDGNSLSIIAGIADESRAASALKYLDRKTRRFYGNAFMDDDSIVDGGSQRVYAFMSTFEIRARFEQPLFVDSALDQIRRTYEWMSVNDPGTTFWEGIGSNGSMYEGAFTSAAHGWSTGVVGLLTNYVLGLRLVNLSCEYVFHPKVGDISWARGTLPSAYGPIIGEWQMLGEILSMSIQPPRGCTGIVVIPVKSSLDLVIHHNGNRIWSGGRAVEDHAIDFEGFVAVPDIESGKHNFMASWTT